MKSNTILLLVILFFVLGCTFNCNGMKENFDDGGLSAFTGWCKSCFENEILVRGQEICNKPDSEFGTIMDEIWTQGPKKKGVLKIPVDPLGSTTTRNMIANRTGGCSAPFCMNDDSVLAQIKNPANKKYLINLVNSECRR
jgi:hypothetical protein